MQWQKQVGRRMKKPFVEFAFKFEFFMNLFDVECWKNALNNKSVCMWELT